MRLSRDAVINIVELARRFDQIVPLSLAMTALSGEHIIIDLALIVRTPLADLETRVRGHPWDAIHLRRS